MKTLLLCSLLVSFALGQYNASEELEYNYTVSPTAQIDLDHKYGNIVIKQGTSNQVQLRIQLDINGRNESHAKKVRERIDFDITALKQVIKVRTHTDKNRSFMSSMVDDVVPGNSFQINLVLIVPATAQLNLNNKYGDVIIAKHSGACVASISHGDLNISQLSGYGNLNVQHGTVAISSMNSGTLSFQYSTVTIQSAQDLLLTSRSVNAIINKANSIKLNSRRDDLSLGQIAAISGESAFSDVQLRSLGKSLVGTHNMGSLNVQAQETVTTVDLSCKNSDISISLPPQQAYNAVVMTEQSSFSYPAGQGNMTSKQLADTKVHAKGTLGNGQIAGTLKINAKQSSIKINP